MSEIKIELNHDAVRNLLRSPEMMSICQEHANSMARSAGKGYKTSRFTGKNRVNVSVVANSKKARKKNSRENTLVKSMYKEKKK